MGRKGLVPHGMNVILTQHGSVSLPAPPHEGDDPMADAPDFPRIYYAAEEPTGRIFESQDEISAAGGTWFKTPAEAADAAATAATPEPTPSEEEASPPTRSRR